MTWLLAALAVGLCWLIGSMVYAALKVLGCMDCDRL